MTDSSTRTVAFYEATADLIQLQNNKLNLQFAKSVVGSDGKLTFNVVWQSKSTAPRTSISWTPIYGLNWTMDLPTSGIKVTIGGIWQQCALGQTYDISRYGLFVPSSSTGKPDYMNIGTNQYNQTGMHILVGVQNSSGGFDIIYADPNTLGYNMNAWYQPQEQVKWWYESNAVSESMISGEGTTVDTYDMSSPSSATGLFYVSSTYLWDAGKWSNNSSAPPSALITGVFSSVLPNAPANVQQQSNNAEIAELQKKIASLENFLNAFLHSTNKDEELGLNPAFIFRGLLNWPAAASVTAIAGGTTIIGTYLTSKNYGFEKKVTTNANGTTTTTMYFGPLSATLQDLAAIAAGPSVPSSVVTDWNNAVNSDSADHPGNGGVSLTSQATSNEQVMIDRKLQAKTIIQGIMNGA